MEIINNLYKGYEWLQTIYDVLVENGVTTTDFGPEDAYEETILF